jgi:tripartite-type tricarboxylate transporter receptor subunit TctC
MAPVAFAQGHYPSRPIRLVVSSAAGGVHDVIGRLWANKLKSALGTIVIDNRGGAGGTLGVGEVARAQPDGYTLLLGSNSTHILHPLVAKHAAYDSIRDFEVVSIFAVTAPSIAVYPAAPARTLEELIAYAKANPGKLTYASQGVGSTAHLSGAQLEALAGIKMVHVPYRGAQPALTDVVAGHVDMFFDTLATSVPLYRNGTVKLLGVADLQRAAAVPEVPTFSEAGLPGFKSITWFGLVAPPATPLALAEKINRDAVDILRRKEVGEMLRKLSLEAGATSPSETTAFFAGETALWSKVIRDANVTPQ